MKFKMSCLALLLFLVLGTTANARDDGFKGRFSNHGRFEHVLLISVDGLHAIDVENYIATHPNSSLALLAKNGVRFTNASTSKPSDSFPGLIALVTGASPVSSGVFYDVSYDRTLYANGDTKCTGPVGNVMTFDETLDAIDAQGNDLNRIDPTKLPYTKNANNECVPVYPHDFIKVNTIFEVVKAADGRTAWCDKHPAYDLVNGPSGKGVDDLFTPEITNPQGLDNTVSVVCTADNDTKKVKAIINEIDGYNHDRTKKVGTPTVFGMNFQAVSVGQKLTKENVNGTCPLTDPPSLVGQKGGYLDAAGTPSVLLEYALDFVDTSLGRMINELQIKGLFHSTLIIVSAKHGQAPIDSTKVNKPGDAALLADLPSDAAVSDDDVALIWLKDLTQADAVAEKLRADQTSLFIQDVLEGDTLKLKFNDPLTESRTPDLIVIPNLGTIYTTSSKKLAEHGGFSNDDTNVGLLVSAPCFSEKVIKSPVETAQVAPTILDALGLDPEDLQAVRKEYTSSLPGLTAVQRENE